MSRTDELRSGGAKERGGGGGLPFVKFGDEYSWVEGKITDIWTGKYGDVAVFTITAASGALQAVGKDEDGKEYRVKVEEGIEVNLGLNHAALDGRIVAEDQGKTMHVAFEGWGETKAGQRFRQFAVLELELELNQPQPDDSDLPPAGGEDEYLDAPDEDGLPF